MYFVLFCDAMYLRELCAFFCCEALCDLHLRKVLYK